MFDGDFDRDAERLTAKLDGFADDPDGLRDAFLHRHVHALYAELTDNGETGLRADDLVYAAAELVPGLTPSRAQVERERERLQKDKEGYEIAQGQLLGHVLANPDAGRHLIDVMLRPTKLALEHADAFEATGQRRPRHRARSPGRQRRHRRAAQPAPPQRRGRHDDRPAGGRDRPRPVSTRRSRSRCCAAASSSTRATPAGASSARA